MKLLWNGEDITIPDYPLYVPLSTFNDMLYAGYLGVGVESIGGKDGLLDKRDKSLDIDVNSVLIDTSFDQLNEVIDELIAENEKEFEKEKEKEKENEMKPTNA